MGLPIIHDIYIFLVFGPLIFFIFLFHSYLILDWLRNRIRCIFFFFFHRVIIILNKCFFRVDARF